MLKDLLDFYMLSIGWRFQYKCAVFPHGKEYANCDDVNHMISTKPYGDRSFYPQNCLLQVLMDYGAAYHTTHRNYCCELAIKRKAILSII